MSEQSTSDPQTGMDRFFGALRGIGIRRRSDDKWLGGVCSGVADRLGVDPVIVRAGLVVLALLGGAGITIYLVAWALLPNDRDEIVAQRAVRDGDVGSVVLLIFAALALFGGSWWGHSSGWDFPWFLVPLGLLAWWLTHRHSESARYADQRVRTEQLSTPATAGPSPMSASADPSAMSPGAPSTMSPGPLPAPAGPVPPTLVPPQTQGWQERYAERRVVPKKPRRRSGGPLIALLAIGLALAMYGSLVWAGNAFSWSGDHRTIALAGSLASIGLLSIVLGVAGWRAGFVGLLAVVLALTAWTSAAVPAGIHFGGRVGDSTWTPISLTAPANDNYQLGIGNGVLDLRRLSTTGLPSAPTSVTPVTPVTIPAYVGLGDLKVLVPAGLSVRVDGHVGLGAIALPDDTREAQGGSDVRRSVVIGNGPTAVVVDAGVGIGQLTVVKE